EEAQLSAAAEGQRIEQALEDETGRCRGPELQHVAAGRDRTRLETEGERAGLPSLHPAAERLRCAQERQMPRAETRGDPSGTERLHAEGPLRDQGQGQRGPKRLTAGRAVDRDGGVRGQETERPRVSEDGVTRPPVTGRHFFFVSTGTSVGAVASGGG